MTKQQGGTKQTKSFRLTSKAQGKINELTTVFRESEGETVERAINYLYENRIEVARQDLEERLKGIKIT